MTVTLWWVRRDLRLADNSALSSALQAGDAVVPVFILDPALLQRHAPARQAFLFAGLRSLDADLRSRGSSLVVRRGSPQAELHRLLAESGATAVYAEADYSPYARTRDSSIASQLPLHLLHALTIHPPELVLKPDGTPYTVFTPFSKAHKALPFSALNSPNPPPSAFAPAPALASYSLPTASAPASFPAGEAEAARRLQHFLSGPIFNYASQRNRLDLEGTSALSPYFRFGMLSARSAAAAAYRAIHTAPDAESRQGAETWLNELIWREFYISIFFHFPHALRTAFKPQLRNIPWRSAPAELQAWKDGLTGYPVVDAAQRQLRQTGWMHNRARMISASFLVKDLLINWQEGEDWFMEKLVDGDPAANNGGWQWVAGVGTDAAPYFRIFNPALQSAKFDPAGNYLRRWVPELASLPTEWIHRPWEMPPRLQQQYGVRIGKDYPAPLVEHAMARQRTLDAYSQAKSGD